MKVSETYAAVNREKTISLILMLTMVDQYNTIPRDDSVAQDFFFALVTNLVKNCSTSFGNGVFNFL